MEARLVWAVVLVSAVSVAVAKPAHGDDRAFNTINAFVQIAKAHREVDLVAVGRSFGIPWSSFVWSGPANGNQLPDFVSFHTVDGGGTIRLEWKLDVSDKPAKVNLPQSRWILRQTITLSFPENKCPPETDFEGAIGSSIQTSSVPGPDAAPPHDIYFFKTTDDMGNPLTIYTMPSRCSLSAEHDVDF